MRQRRTNNTRQNRGASPIFPIFEWVNWAINSFNKGLTIMRMDPWGGTPDPPGITDWMREMLPDRPRYTGKAAFPDVHKVAQRLFDLKARKYLDDMEYKLIRQIQGSVKK